MGIRTTVSGDVQHLDLSNVADDMLADVIADHTAERFRSSNRANRELAGTDIAYSVTVDGRVVHLGRGQIFPERQVSTILRSGVPVRAARHSIVVDWLWQQLQLATLKRVISSYGQIDSMVDLARVIANPGGELLGFLLKQYLKHRFPALRVEQIDLLWKGYRMARLAGNALGGADDATADPDVLAWIADELIARSPFVSGNYRDAHALYADQRFLMAAEDVTADSKLPAAKEWSFTNAIPYARKIEFGKTQSGRDFVVQVPNRIYERVAQDAAARFGRMAKIEFEMRALVGGDQVNQAQAHSFGQPWWLGDGGGARAASGVLESGVARRHGKTAHNRAGVRYPSIVVTF
jgi:hypothetical protein